ncbi:MAG: cytochrome P450 [Kofleriaceae bacterium]
MQRVSYLRDPIGTMERYQRALGDIYLVALGPGMVFVSTPELAKEVLTQPEENLVAGEAKLHVFGKILGDSSTLLLDGPAHLKRRRLLLPRFRGELAQELAPAMRAACDQVLRELPIGHEFALHPYMHRIAFAVISSSLFASTPRQRIHALESACRTFAHRAVTSRLLMFRQLQKDFPFSPWTKVQTVVSEARRAVLSEIRARRAAKQDGDDILGMLLTATDDDGASLTEAAIVDEILTMVAAGHETTSMALTWLCYAVYSRPDVLAKLREGDPAYREATVRESLRMYSVIPNGSGRLAKRDFELGGYTVPKGSLVTIAFHQVHRRLDIFADAETFKPERFLDAKYGPYESLPFGGGTRRCLGMPFAMFELGLVLQAMVERFDLEVVQKQVKPMWRGRFLTPSKGLLVKAATRA